MDTRIAQDHKPTDTETSLAVALWVMPADEYRRLPASDRRRLQDAMDCVTAAIGNAAYAIDEGHDMRESARFFGVPDAFFPLLATYLPDPIRPLEHWCSDSELPMSDDRPFAVVAATRHEPEPTITIRKRYRKGERGEAIRVGVAAITDFESWRAVAEYRPIRRHCRLPARHSLRPDEPIMPTDHSYRPTPMKTVFQTNRIRYVHSRIRSTGGKPIRLPRGMANKCHKQIPA